jgi:hypothetical protein
VYKYNTYNTCCICQWYIMKCNVWSCHMVAAFFNCQCIQFRYSKYLLEFRQQVGELCSLKKLLCLCILRDSGFQNLIGILSYLILSYQSLLYPKYHNSPSFFTIAISKPSVFTNHYSVIPLTPVPTVEMWNRNCL